MDGPAHREPTAAPVDDLPLAELVEPLLRFAGSLVRDPDVAADLVQDTLLRAHRSRATFRGEASALTWTRRILHNLAIDRGRRPERELPVADVEVRWRDDAYTVDPVVVVERAEQRAELEDALTRLPFIYRSTVVLHDIEGWTVREIADAVDASITAVKQRLRRGRMLLVDALAGAERRRVVLKGVPMRCWTARRLVSDYLDETLPLSDRTQLEAHLGTCPTCPPLYTALVGARAALGGLRDADDVIPPDVRDRLARSVTVVRD